VQHGKQAKRNDPSSGLEPTATADAVAVMVLRGPMSPGAAAPLSFAVRPWRIADVPERAWWSVLRLTARGAAADSERCPAPLRGCRDPSAGRRCGPLVPSPTVGTGRSARGRPSGRQVARRAVDRPRCGSRFRGGARRPADAVVTDGTAAWAVVSPAPSSAQGPVTPPDQGVTEQGRFSRRPRPTQQRQSGRKSGTPPAAQPNKPLEQTGARHRRGAGPRSRSAPVAQL